MQRGDGMLTLYTPGYDDLWFRQAMLADEETMSYNHAWGGTIPFPEDRWKDWYGRWVARDAQDEDEEKRFYRYLRNEDGAFVGEIAYHTDSESGCRMCLADVLIFAPYRGKGYGGQALELLCSAAKENGFAELYDDIAADNPAASLFLRHGFTVDHRTDDKIYLKKTL